MTRKQAGVLSLIRPPGLTPTKALAQLALQRGEDNPTLRNVVALDQGSLRARVNQMLEHAHDVIQEQRQRAQILERTLSGNVTVEMIRREANQEVRALMLDIYGIENFMHDVGARVIATDAFGELLEYVLDVEDTHRPTFTGTITMPTSDAFGGAWDRAPAHIRAVRVTNSSPEPDGTYKQYILRVPPDCETPQEALAWTFGLENAEEYDPALMT